MFPSLLSNKNQTKASAPVTKPNPEAWKNDEVNIAWLGHSTVLLNIYGKIILTDPVLFDRFGVYFLGITFGPSRYSAPALAFDELPKPDLVLLSHAHMDHMDYQSLKNLTDKYEKQLDCLTAFNTADVIEALPWKSLSEIDWWETKNINGLNIKALEVKHFGWRFPGEHDRSRGYYENGRSFNAYVLERNGIKILFGGDTAMTNKFKESNEEVDVAIMPIGAYNPWKFNHCNPEEALQMAEDVKAKFFIPIHTETFRQGNEPRGEAIQRMLEAYRQCNVTLGLSKIGETFTFPAV